MRRRRDPRDEVIRLPAHAVHAHWELSRPVAALEFDLTVHDDPGSSVGEYLGLFNGRIDGAGFYFGLQTDMNRPGHGGVGKGLIFSTWWSFDTADTRIPDDGFVELGTHESRFVGVRRPYRWGAVDYRVSLARTEPDRSGGRPHDWFALSITPTGGPAGPAAWIGSLRFPRRELSAPATVERTGVSFLEVYAGARTWAEVPRWWVDLMAYGDGELCPTGRTAYTDHPHGQAMPNADIAYQRDRHRVVMAFGSGIERVHRGTRWP